MHLTATDRPTAAQMTRIDREPDAAHATLPLRRVGGLALVLGAVTFGVHLVARSVITAAAGGDPATFVTAEQWALVNSLGVVGAVLVVLGLPALAVRLAAAAAWLGVVGVVLLALGWMMLGGFVSLYSATVLPWLAANAPPLVDSQPPGLVVAFVIGLLAELLGTLLVAIPFLRGRVPPRWVGYVLLAAVLMTLIGDFVIAPSGPAANLAVNLVSNLGPVLLVVALGAVGARLWSGARLSSGSSGADSAG